MNSTLFLIPAIFLVGCQTTPSRSESPKVISETLVKSTKSWNGKILPAYPKGQPEVSLLRITIPPGTKLPMHYHPVINAGVLLKGELKVHSIGGKEKSLKAGDALIELVDELHYGESVGSEPAVIIVVYAGTTGTPVTVKPD